MINLSLFPSSVWIGTNCLKLKKIKMIYYWFWLIADDRNAYSTLHTCFHRCYRHSRRLRCTEWQSSDICRWYIETFLLDNRRLFQKTQLINLTVNWLVVKWLPFSHMSSSSSLPSTQSLTALQNEYWGKHWPLLHLWALRSQAIPWSQWNEKVIFI